MSALAFRSILLLVAPLACLASVEPISRAALIGSTITLSCPRNPEGNDGGDDVMMMWSKGRDVIFEDEGMVMSEKWNSDKFDLSIETPSFYNLTINTITDKDTDSYVCTLYNMDTDEKIRLAEFDVAVLEKPECVKPGGDVNMLVRGQAYDFTCTSTVNDVTLLWSVGTTEKNIGKNIVDPVNEEKITYKTTQTLVADASLQGKTVDCELQHPWWSVEEGVLKCSFGAINVENSVDIHCDEAKQKNDGIVCEVKNRDVESSADPIGENEIKWLVKGQDPSTAKSVDASMIEPLADASGFVVTLKSDQKGEMHALTVRDNVGPWQKMPAKEESGNIGGAGEKTDGGGSGQTGMIVVIAVIAILVVVIVVVVILWKRNVIFSASKSKGAGDDAEKGAPKLNGVTYNNGTGVNGVRTGSATDEKTLLNNKDDSNVDEKKTRPEEEGRRASDASSEDDKKLIIDSDSGKTKNSEIDA